MNQNQIIPPMPPKSPGWEYFLFYIAGVFGGFTWTIGGLVLINTMTPFGATLSIPGVVVTIIALIVAIFRKPWQRRPAEIGLLTGVILALLAVGACFALVARFMRDRQ